MKTCLIPKSGSPVRSVTYSLKLVDYLSAQADKPFSIFHLRSLIEADNLIGQNSKFRNNFNFRNNAMFFVLLLLFFFLLRLLK